MSAGAQPSALVLDLPCAADSDSARAGARARAEASESAMEIVMPINIPYGMFIGNTAR
jgi:hypothetical protein